MVKPAPARRRPRKAKPGTKGLGPAECRLEQPTGAAAEAAKAIEEAGGCVVGSYKETLAGHPVLLSVLPIDAVEPTPFQPNTRPEVAGSRRQQFSLTSINC